MLLRITEQAADQIRASIEEGGMQGMALRVAARRLEDGTIDYAMGFDEAGDNDTRSEQYGIELLIAPTSTELLSGAILDFATPEEEKAPQFIFLNPNDPHFVPPEAVPDPKP